MHHGWGSVRTVEGELSVGDEALHVSKSPRTFLRGQFARLRYGDRWEGVAALFRIAGFLVLPLLVASRLYTAPWGSLGLAALVSLGLAVLGLVPFYANHVRGTTIPLSTIEDVTLDADEREVTITHVTEGRLSRLSDRDDGDGDDRGWFGSDRLRSLFGEHETETTLTLRSTDDVRAVRSIFRTRRLVDGVELEEPESTETTYRIDTERGVAFCERCGSQVSPGEPTCPACDYALRVERPAGDRRERERSTER
ncbi:hypothetical protein [Salinigranum sp. GCM10025319]|uniref:hypothetical protein n=1 Tax=Salinigranum sp. GCM10025319 TaxID=3252687 RepID=UPI0036153C63